MFRQTKCARVARFLPLFATGDLTRRQARFVNAHLKACAACRQIGAEFQASRDWLQQGAQVEFADEFYEGIRNAVLSQIETQRPRARWLPPAFFSVPQLNRPLAFVASVALLCLFSVLALQLAGRRKADQPDSQANYTQQQPPTPAHSPLPEALSTDENVIRQSLQPKLRAPLPRRRGARQFARNENQPRLPTANESRSQVASLKGRAPSPALVSQNQTNAMSVIHTATAEVSRIEMQTADPNIRIIWLTPKADETSPAKIIENR